MDGVSRTQWLWAVALAATIVLASGNQVTDLPGWIPSPDKIVHVAVFGLLGTLVGRVDPTRDWRWLGPWWAVVIVSAFGGTDELHQSLTPGRSMDYRDWVADTLGAGIAVTAYWRWAAYRRLLERPLFTRRVKTSRRVETRAAGVSSPAP